MSLTILDVSLINLLESVFKVILCGGFYSDYSCVVNIEEIFLRYR